MDKNNKNRKYSLIDKNIAEWQEEEKKEGLGLCVKRFHADFVIDDLKNKYKLGDLIELNGEVCHITEVGKRCFPSDCSLFKKLNHSCPLKDGVMFVS